MDADFRCAHPEGDSIARQCTNTGSRVPLDIVELVMERLASVGSLWALRQCSLACKDFAAICQKHIFTEIHLSNEGGFECGNRTFPALTSFKKALDNKPYLEGYARVLYYHHDFDRHRQWPPVLRRLRHVQSLHIWFLPMKDISWYSSRIGPSFKASLLRFIQSNRITYLHLYIIHDLPTHIFALFPCLEVLEMRAITLDNDPPFSQESPPKLRALHILCAAEALSTLIASQNGIVDLRALKHLDIDLGHNPSLMGFIRVLLSQSEVLESLKFEGSLPELNFHDNLAKYLTGKSLQNLRGIELTIDLWKIEDDPYLNLTCELEKLSGRNVLEHLILSIVVPLCSTSTTEISRWSELDRVLSQPSAFPRLSRVQVTVEVHYFYECDRKKDMEERLAVVCDEAFPWLKENDQVEFVISFEVSSVD